MADVGTAEGSVLNSAYCGGKTYQSILKDDSRLENKESNSMRLKNRGNDQDRARVVLTPEI